MINFTLESTTFIIHSLAGHFIPSLQHNSIIIVIPLSTSVLLSLTLLYFIPWCMFPLLVLLCWDMQSSISSVLICLDWNYSISTQSPFSPFGTPKYVSALLHYIWLYTLPVSTPWSGLLLLCFIPCFIHPWYHFCTRIRHYSILIGAPLSWLSFHNSILHSIWFFRCSSTSMCAPPPR